MAPGYSRILPTRICMWIFCLGLVHARCLYGPDCYFPCNCATRSDTECQAGCPGGCASITDFNTPWSGPGCQIGNVAYNRPASSVHQSSISRFEPEFAVDGRAQTMSSVEHHHNYCAHPKPPGGNVDDPTAPAWWWVDLGALHKIYNITIYGRAHCIELRNDAECAKRLNYFELHVGNSSNYETGELCATYTSGPIPIQEPLGGHETFTCPTPLYGSHVYFQRLGDGYQPGITSLCEVIVIGHKYLDCADVKCESGRCSDVTGCKTCLGAYPPLCTDGCEESQYGVNCAQKCGNCSSMAACDRQNGTCPAGCLLWSVGSKCDQHIDEPVVNKESATAPATNGHDSVTISWESLTTVSPALSEFYKYRVMYNLDGQDQSSELLDHQYGTLSHKVTDLTYNTEYSFTVIAYRVMDGTEEQGGSYQPITAKTACIAPSEPEIKDIAVGNSTVDGVGTILVEYQVPLSNESGCDSLDRVDISYKHEGDNEFTVTRGDLTKTWYLVQPKGGGRHEVKVTVTNNGGESSSSQTALVDVTGPVREKPGNNDPDHTVTIVAAVVSVVVIAGATLVAVFVYRRKRRKNDDAKSQSSNIGKSPEEGVHEMDNMDTFKGDGNGTEKEKIENVEDPYMITNTNTSTIPCLEFEQYVRQKKANSDDFTREYKSLPQEDVSKCQVAQTVDNLKRNRYKNIYAYDVNRVILSGDSSEPDYINANYITGYVRAREYIATQGPRENTDAEFWRMIWQEKANTIVMLANKLENGKKKCSDYWPMEAGATTSVDRFKVTTEAVEQCADYTTSVLSLHCEDKTMTVRHFHFKTWEDKSMPVYGVPSLLAFFRKVHSFDTLQRGPMVVHCSAGVGRTGVFIVLDILRKQVAKAGAVDVYGTVQRARTERMHMVQTQDQYVFVHDFLVEYIKCRNTSIPCAEFENNFAKLSQRQNGKSPLERQFKLLCDLKQPNVNTHKDGCLPVHSSKNREMSVIPENLARPHLLGREEDSYINAVFVDSYKEHDSYIVTQLPLPHTKTDFWRLVHAQDATTIVTLNNVTQHDQEFWPSEEEPCRDYGPVRVTLAETKPVTKMIISRTFNVEKANQKLSAPAPLVVRQFQLLSWPDDQDIPSQPGHLVDLSEHVTHWQQQQAASKIVTIIQCLDGVSHSGLYCGLMFVLDRMKLEQEVDPFIAVRCVARNRPEFFKSLEQYEFLYKMARDYMTQFNTYANLQ